MSEKEVLKRGIKYLNSGAITPANIGLSEESVEEVIAGLQESLAKAIEEVYGENE